MKKVRLLIQTQAFRKHSTLLSILSYFLIYLAVLGLGWSEKGGLGSWHWKLFILFSSTILFVITIARSFFYEESSLQTKKIGQANEALLAKIEGLEQQKKEAIEANEAKTRFLAEMSHEIRNPLNSILGFSEILSKRKLDNKSKKFANMIFESGDGLLRLLNDILDLNKIEDGKLSLEAIPFHFKEVISSSLLPYEYVAKQKGVQFELIFDPALPDILVADPYRLRQILMNLVSNSMKFTQAGKIRLRFDKLGIEEGKLRLRTSISDSGIGIAVEKQERIFKAFIQSDTSIARKFGGSGLGLTIVAELLKLMGGEVRVKSPLSKAISRKGGPGTCFSFEILVPFSQNKPEPREETPDMDESEDLLIDSPLRILIAEDNAVNQVLFQSFLENMGLGAKIVGNGQEAVEALKKAEFDLIFMDIQMPVMDGLQASKMIRGELGLSTPIIGATANAFKEDIRISLQAGMNDYIPKPFRQRDLYEKILKWGVKIKNPLKLGLRSKHAGSIGK